MRLNVTELFYSIQGEGRRAGEPSLFVRLQGCSMKHGCYQSGIICDTQFESGRAMSLEEIAKWCGETAPMCRWIIFTGGEPADQLTPEVVEFFHARQYLLAIETSGVKPIPPGLDWVSLSPKVAEHVLEKNFPNGVSEVRYVIHAGQCIPQTRIQSAFKFLSPHSDGPYINRENLRHCIELCKEHPEWSLSVQQHKMWEVL